MSPAMAAGVSDRLWDIGNIVALVEATGAAREARLLQKARSGLAYVVETLAAFAH